MELRDPVSQEFPIPGMDGPITSGRLRLTALLNFSPLIDSSTRHSASGRKSSLIDYTLLLLLSSLGLYWEWETDKMIPNLVRETRDCYKIVEERGGPCYKA